MFVGIDIGGTHTDGVLIDHQENIIAAVKTKTTALIQYGFTNVLCQLLQKSNHSPEAIQGLFIGTTHAMNAILQRKELYKVGVLRIAGHQPEMLPSCFSWPHDLKKSLFVATETIHGGFECHGGPITSFCSKEVRHAIEKLLQQGAEGIAVIGVFSPLNNEQEKEVGRLIEEMTHPHFPFSLSHELGGIGFIERENATLLNTALKKVLSNGFQELKYAAQKLGIDCPLRLTQNNGSSLSLEQALLKPLLTLSAGPTNSFMGGGRLLSQDSAIIVDIGGTSTDVGILQNGFPVRSLNTTQIGGISLNLPMPNVLSIPLGGGTKVDNSFTLTDIALSLGYLQIPNIPIQSIPKDYGESIVKKMGEKIQFLVSQIEGKHRDLPIILVGGGARLIPLHFLNHRFQMPPYYDVANAYGAALAEVSGSIDTIVSLQHREQTLEKLHDEARQKAIEQGAEAKLLRLCDFEMMPYSYIPNQMARVMIRYSGKLKKSVDCF